MKYNLSVFEIDKGRFHNFQFPVFRNVTSGYFDQTMLHFARVSGFSNCQKTSRRSVEISYVKDFKNIKVIFTENLFLFLGEKLRFSWKQKYKLVIHFHGGE